METTKDDTEKKKVFIKTTSGRNYTGVIINEDSNFITIIDKFDKEVRISAREIEVIEEDRE